ncbi:transglutaminase family protein [Acidiphilium acidophilum]|uniref:Transglutaminase family protein n=1 Tax=Acidiphilium acidophilum TaxID=76588 RepID=A0AAW9DTN0_ACIAO|nr:transglutaminase family protein [Acidiphilium acidophilum]MDX5932413.1 transglutaminase family protein [Acidiphilium acidophilum]
MRYRLTHSTLYTYQTKAIRARHFLHLLPRARPGQILDVATLAIEPAPSDRYDEFDYFGNRITSVDIDAPHDMFHATVRADILLDPRPPLEHAGLAWESIANDTALPPDIAEFAVPTRLTGADDGVLALARRHFTPQADMMAATAGLSHHLYEIFRYRSGVTSVTTTGPAALAKREGVCQDYAQAMLACLRAIGLPARYVSGYLRSQTVSPDSGNPDSGYSGAEQTHAWVSVWFGPQHGWVDFDPTNDLIVAGEHVTLAWGRDFTDVSPTCGIILGGRRHTLKVSVVLAPVADHPA